MAVAVKTYRKFEQSARTGSVCRSWREPGRSLEGVAGAGLVPLTEWSTRSRSRIPGDDTALVGRPRTTDRLPCRRDELSATSEKDPSLTKRFDHLSAAGPLDHPRWHNSDCSHPAPRCQSFDRRSISCWSVLLVKLSLHHNCWILGRNGAEVRPAATCARRLRSRTTGPSVVEFRQRLEADFFRSSASLCSTTPKTNCLTRPQNKAD